MSGMLYMLCWKNCKRMYKKLPAVFDEGTPLAFYRGLKFLSRRVRNYLFSVFDVAFSSLFVSASAGTIGG